MKTPELKSIEPGLGHRRPDSLARRIGFVCLDKSRSGVVPQEH
jgi:hypothetical protein